MTQCSVDTCDDVVLARGWCAKHYSRWRSNGDPLKTTSRWDGHVKTERPCEIDGCENLVTKTRFCAKHRMRLHRHGDTSTVLPRGGHNALATEEKLWPRVAKGGPDECWPWTGPVNEWGYGTITVDGRRQGTHRAAFFLANGRWPEPICRHTCDNPACCNPAHLIEGTHADNNRDMVERGRERHPVGSAHGTHTQPESRLYGTRNKSAKLVDAQVRAIRAAWATGAVRKKDLAKRYGVSEGAIYRIISRRGWTHLE